MSVMLRRQAEVGKIEEPKAKKAKFKLIQAIIALPNSQP